MKAILVLLTGTIALTAIISGVLMLMEPEGGLLNLSTSLLANTPFYDFTIPGLVLFFVVGGSNITAALSIIQGNQYAPSFSLVAGILISIWILLQMIMIGVLFWLKFIYLGAGVLIFLISFQLKGKSLI